MNKNEFFEAIASALEVEVKVISLELKIDDIPEWDSLGQLTILSQIDDMTDGKASEIPKIGTMESLEDIWNALVGAGLASDT
tara:strand:- start:730 stop:975 length:246 start_codon:yes stop_codon:yes gene_type:complete